MNNLKDHYSVIISLKSLYTSQCFEMASPNIKEVKNLYIDFISIFSEIDEKGNILKKCKALQNNSSKIRSGIFDFTRIYGSNLPEINCLISFFKKTPLNEPFIILIGERLLPKVSFEITDYLNSLKSEKSFEYYNSHTKELFGKLFENYSIRGVGDVRMSIGNKNKAERNCRFCKKSEPDTTFNMKAHAISEALGNKTILLYDECDNCNKRFSETIENDIVVYLSLFRTFFDVKGKGGLKKISGKNFKMSKGDKVNIQINNIDDRPKEGNDYNLKLDYGDKIKAQNIYKILCKYFLSVIDEEELSNFDETLRWINCEKQKRKLPLIAECISNEHFTDKPRLYYFIRNGNNKKMPYAVCQFNFTITMFVFIIPLSSMDSNTFLGMNVWNEIFETFNFLKDKKWSFNDYSSNQPLNLVVNLNGKKE